MNMEIDWQLCMKKPIACVRQKSSAESTPSAEENVNPHPAVRHEALQ